MPSWLGTRLPPQQRHTEMTKQHAQQPLPGLLAESLVGNGHLLALAILLILVAGLAAWVNLPRIEDPRITNRNVLVVTQLPGGDAARVEALVTEPLEQALREVAEVETLESTSRAGVSLIAIELRDSVGADDNERVFADLRDTLADVDLPPEVTGPRLDDQRGAVAFSLIVAVANDRAGPAPMALLERLSQELAERLRNLSGSEQVVRFGAVDEEVRVIVDADELAALGLTPAHLAARLAEADAKRPAGTLRPGGSRLQIEVDGAFTAVERIAAVPLASASGAVVSIGDIAEVSKGWTEPATEIAFANGRRAVLVAVRTRPGVHLDDWTERARAVVAGFSTITGDGVRVDIDFDQSRYTDARLQTLGGNLLAGAGIIVAVVLLTMGWRAALIVGSALPLTAALTLFGLDLAGHQIHQMTVFGMIIAIGLLIDNAVVITDEVIDRRRAGLAPSAAARTAVTHLAGPLAASTVTTILGFMPIFLLPGNIGDFVGPIAVAVILALAFSFLLSMTLIPALAARFAVKPAAGRCRRWWRDGWTSPVLAAGYRGLLITALRRPLVTLLCCLVLPAAGFVLIARLDNQFFPPADRDQFEVEVWLDPAAEIGTTAETVQEMERIIRDSGDVHGLTWVVGASSPPVYYNQLRDQDANPVYARGNVLAANTAEAERLVALLQSRLADAFPQARVVVQAFGQGPPMSAPVSLRLVGSDPEQLRRLGEGLRLLLAEHPDVTATGAGIEGAVPKLYLAADEDKARLAGLGLGTIADQFQATLEGTVGGRVLEDLTDLPVRVRLAHGEQDDPARAATLLLVGQDPATGESIRLPAEALGALRLQPAVPAISRRNGERVNRIDAWLRPDALPIEVTRAVLDRVENGELLLPPGYRLEVAGDSEQSGEAIGQLLAYAPLLGTLMVATLVLGFRSFALAGLVILVGVLSLALGLLSLWLAGYPLGFNPILGSAGLLGVAINASIVVLAALRADSVASVGEPTAMANVVQRASRHIITSTLTTIGGFLPLILAGGAFWPPLAVVIAGGVGLSILLGLFFTPAAFRLGRLAADRAETVSLRSGTFFERGGAQPRPLSPVVPTSNAGGR
jgi:multidrug efflux pump